MKKLTLILLLVILILPAAAFTIYGEANEYNDDARNEANLKLLRYRAKQYQRGNTRNRFLSDDIRNEGILNSSCGSINIGNINSIDGRLRENIIIIDGDIINADNYCR